MLNDTRRSCWVLSGPLVRVKTNQIMEKSVFEKKWKAVLPKLSNGYWYVMCGYTEICTVYSSDQESKAKKTEFNETRP